MNAREQAREQARNAMKRAWTIRKTAAVECGCKVSEVVFSECLRLAWREIKMIFTATAQGVKFDATRHQAKCIATKTGRVWGIILTADEIRDNGFSVPAGKECLVRCDDQSGFEAWYRKQQTAKFEAEQAAKMATLEGQRDALKAEVENTYSEDHFPGSRAYNKYIAAEKALDAFDAAHPEIKAAALKASAERRAERQADFNVWS